jgi:mannose-6-phosphate isomerase-like protein (cupin superfamily)
LAGGAIFSEDAMERPAHEENEARILYFRRDKLDEGVHAATVALRRGESSTFHKHTRTRDTFYVMSGRLTIVIKTTTADSSLAYHAVVTTPTRVEETKGSGFVHTVRVLPGEVVIIEPEVAHCASNVDDAPCRFMCLEGVGTYDFVPQ